LPSLTSPPEHFDPVTSYLDNKLKLIARKRGFSLECARYYLLDLAGFSPVHEWGLGEGLEEKSGLTKAIALYQNLT
jgi:hypothetical protein